MLGSNYKEVLLKYFDKEHLPVRYGGTLTDENGDPDCRAHICFGGVVPRSYYLTCDRSQMEEVTIPRGGELRLCKSVPDAGHLFTWSFSSESHDVGFGVSFRPKGGANEPVVVLREMRRTIAHIVPEQGSCLSDQAGSFELLLDNTYSWTRAKRMWVRLEILCPEEQRSRMEKKKAEEKRRREEKVEEVEEEEEEDEEGEGEGEDDDEDAASIQSFHSAQSEVSDRP